MLELFENRLFAYAYDSKLLAVVCWPADKPAVSASLNWALSRIQEWCNLCCMILNPTKMKALVVSRSRTVSPPHGDLVLSGVSIWASPNLDILGMKFDIKLAFETISMVLFPVSLRELIFCGWWNVYLWKPLCYFIAIFQLFSQSLSIVLRCGGQLLNIAFSLLSARYIQWPGFVQIRVSCCCVIDVIWLAQYVVQG